MNLIEWTLSVLAGIAVTWAIHERRRRQHVQRQYDILRDASLPRFSPRPQVVKADHADMKFGPMP